MKKEYHILINFGLYIITFISIIIVGITGVFAETYDAYLFKAQLYDNSNGSLSTVTTNFSNNYWTGTIPYMSANTSGAAWGISSPIPLVANHTYTITVFISHEYGNTVLSTYNRIGVGSSFNEAKTSYQNNTNCNEVLSKTQSLVYGQGLQFAFTPTVNANYIVFPFATSLSGSNVKFDLNNITIDDVGTSGVSETTINNSLNNQTNIINGAITSSESNIKNNDNANRDTIINNQNSNKQAIIDNQNANNEALIDSNTQNTQDIIDNQNANNQKILDDNKRNFNDCRDSYNILHIYWNKGYTYTANGITYTVNDDYSITINGTATANSFFNLNMASGYENEITSGKTYYLSIGTALNGLSFVLRDPNGNALIYLSNQESKSWKSNYTGKGTTYIRITNGTTVNNLKVYPMLTEGQPINDYEEYGKEVCTNKLDEANKTSKGILGKLGDLLSYINPFSENFFVYKMVELFLEMLKSLFIPEDMSFINDFLDVISNKLGFIASIPIQIIEFILDLPNYLFDEVTSLHFPSIDILGYQFWGDMEIDLSSGISIFSAFKYLTDIACVVLCVNTLYKWYHSFSGGDAN